jgi:ABC-type proline/glycine betaine transport system substrate-binding protein
MMAAIDLAKQTPAQAAKDWIERSENIWPNWSPVKKQQFA